jgi:hypothetical protein
MSNAVCWVTTDSSCLLTEFADVVILGEDNEELFSATLKVHSDAPIHVVHIDAMYKILGAGWSMNERTIALVESGYTVNVEKVS